MKRRMRRRAGRTRDDAARLLAAALAVGAAVAGCGLAGGSPLVDDVKPGSVGRGLPLEGAELTVTSKEFTEQLILGQILALALEAAGADVRDRTGIQGAVGAREAVARGDADVMYEYTGTAWTTYLGSERPFADPRQQWQALREADLKNGITWLPPAALNNTYALATSPANAKKYRTKTLSEVAALSKKDPSAVTLCVENDFAARDDGLNGMRKAYAMGVPAGAVATMDGGTVYTRLSEGGSCTYGEVFTTDGRIKAMGLTVMTDDRHFFPNYNAAPEINSKSLKKYPAMADVLGPITKKLDNAVARELNARVDVDGEDPHSVAKEWLVREGFVRAG
ncbi:glycine betaine ABC transporter substrate-binding protein [Streptomyces spiramyceticus]|uniref:glycine betaine ABC transporter substrate-binding protein n=1 Tax=Streptomyces spiramyceticus TaxID=299717 RepID=UPI00237A8315|nr:glycine betaine ABC transporter substrate-binding protein [Streptomyces spiramyceticus]